MFDQFLVSTEKDKRLVMKWSKSIPALVRTPIFSDGYGYIVSYAEKDREYILSKFNPDNGDFAWSCNLRNGGYGTIAVGSKVAAVPTSFSNITGVDKGTGNVLWVHKTESRVRSAVAFEDGRFLFSSGAEVIQLDERGQVISSYQLDGHFFYGLIKRSGKYLFSLCTFTNNKGRSEVAVLCFHMDGKLEWKKILGPGHVISSDTSGVCLHQNNIYVASNTSLYCLGAFTGDEIWKTETGERVGRQMPTHFKKKLFVPSLNGTVFCADLETGATKWTFRGATIASTPVSFLDELACVSMDGQIHLLDIDTGRPFDQIPTGHSPYSAITFYDGKAFLGGGDPPYHGRLYAFDCADRKVSFSYAIMATAINAKVESSMFHLQFEVTNCDEELTGVFLDASVMTETITNGPVSLLKPASRDNNRFIFDVPIRPSIVDGLYCVDLYLHLASGGKICRTGLVSIESEIPPPSRFVMSNVRPTAQTNDLNSGAAVAQMMQEIFDQPVTDQDSFRAIVDHVIDRANYEPFNIWRIAFRRGLSANAKAVEDLPEYANEAN